MATISKQEYQQHCRDNLAQYREFIASLPDERWDEPSLCAGWKVRDVVGHLTVGRTMSLPKVFVHVAKGRFKLDATVDKICRAYGESHTPAEIRATFNEETSRAKETGLASVQPPPAKLADNLTHLLDIAVPLGIDVDIPKERLVAALEASCAVNFWGTKRRSKGVRLIAEDVDWAHGDGPEVRGTAADLILALGGRHGVADRLTGDGVRVLVGA